MKIHPDDLAPGCLLTKDVMGKALHPIVPRNTVIEPLHIHILKRFKVQTVDVAPRLVNGEPFTVEKKERKKEQPKEEEIKTEDRSDWSFFDYYANAVKETKQLAEQIKTTNQLDIQQIRTLLFPLFEHSEEQKDLLLQLHHYTDKHNYIFHHMVSVAVIAFKLSKDLGYEHGERLKVGLAGYLSDFGMVKDLEAIYLNANNLSDEEYEKVKKHPVSSYRLIESISSISKDVKVAVLQHHERMDGSGYPLGMNEDKIHPFAQVIGVSDTFHAMTSERVYRKKQSPFKVVEELLQRQAGKLDIRPIQALVQNHLTLQVGTNVRLSNLSKGTIVFIQESNPARPFVQLEGKEEKIVDLSEHLDLYIEEVVEN